MTPSTSPAPVVVRPARADDAERLVDWVLQGALESEGRRLDRRIVATGVAAAVGDPTHRRYYLAERGPEAVGCCMVTTEWSDWEARWYWWLQSVYIPPEHRGKTNGVLDAIVGHVHAAAKGNGAPMVYLYVHETNTRAIHAYEKRGYRRTDYRVYEQEP